MHFNVVQCFPIVRRCLLQCLPILVQTINAAQPRFARSLEKMMRCALDACNVHSRTLAFVRSTVLQGQTCITHSSAFRAVHGPINPLTHVAAVAGRPAPTAHCHCVKDRAFTHGADRWRNRRLNKYVFASPSNSNDANQTKQRQQRISKYDKYICFAEMPHRYGMLPPHIYIYIY